MRLQDLLSAANGRRRIRILGLAEVERLIERAEVAEDGWSEWLSGGTVCFSYGYAAYTTVAAVARIDGVVYLGVGVGYASTISSPAIAWCEWRGMWSAKSSRRLEKLRAWVEHHLGDTVFQASDLVASPEPVKCVATRPDRRAARAGQVPHPGERAGHREEP